MSAATTVSRAASWFEIIAARAWNLLNEGAAFHPIFCAGSFLLYHASDLARVRALPMVAGLAAGAPVMIIYIIYDFPLHLRWLLWPPLMLWMGLGGPPPVALLGLAMALYLFFTIFIWGSLYYHLRIGTPLTNFTRFWRMVLENSDSTSGNAQEQIPKALLVLCLMQWGYSRWTTPAAGGALGAFWPVWVLAVGLGAYAWGTHRAFITWKPVLPANPSPAVATPDTQVKRVYAVVIDGCRCDKLRLAPTPFLDALAAQGATFTRMETVYPARTVVCFSSMLTGAPPQVHGMRSNLVLSLGVKCESLFDTLRAGGKKGLLYACAHLVDAFGDYCRPFSAVGDNDHVDGRIMAGAKDLIERERPDLFMVQLIATDQTGHSLGVHEQAYLDKIAETDSHIATFYQWLQKKGLLDDALFLVMADHGQSRGIGGHGHLDEGERYVPFIIAGPGIAAGRVVERPHSILSLAPTLAALLGVKAPSAACGPVLTEALRQMPAPRRLEKLIVVIPARNEAATVGNVISRIPRRFLPDLRVEVLVIDDGSNDETAAAARHSGADHLISGPARGLGAAVRTGLDRARALCPEYVILLDADGEYPPEAIPDLLAPLRLGEADYVLGSRFRGYIRRMRLMRRLGNWTFTLLQSALLGRWLTDGQTGMRAMNSKALNALELISDYNYAQVMTLNLVRQGYRLTEVPITYAAHPNPTRSFIRFFPYVRHVLSAVWQEVHRHPRQTSAATRSARSVQR